MPKGIPARGFRMTQKRLIAGDPMIDRLANMTYQVDSSETDEQISARISNRFDILNTLAKSCTSGESRSLICSGPAGLGKSHTVERLLASWDPKGENHTIIKGYVRATGLIRTLYTHRDAKHVIVFDDADSIFFDDISLNLLKAVCDTTERRIVSWFSEKVFIDEDTGDTIPKSFQFDGAIIFLSNYDFDVMIASNHRLGPHLQALMSRSHYVSLSLRTRRDYLVRINQVIKDGLLSHISPDAREEVTEYLNKNAERLRELSLRMAIKIASIRKSSPKDWTNICDIICCRE